MSGEWKPGDVAMVTFHARGNPVSVVGVRTTYEKVGADVWWTSRGWIGDHSAKVVRPLVVIDPEDREQVERLADLVNSAYCADPHDAAEGYDLRCYQRGLREFANPTPPKPDEPLGLGAVVEDIHGRRYQRIDVDHAPWLRSDITAEAALDWREFGQIDVVRVLSEGVAS